MNDLIEKAFPASVETLPDIISFVEQELERTDCPMKATMQISVCVEEIFVNIAHYAYQGRIGSMTLSISANTQSVTLVFTDSGIPFNPLERTDPDITLSAEERTIGGLGIFMVKKSMDHVDYQRIDGQNVFSMTKQIGGNP